MKNKKKISSFFLFLITFISISSFSSTAVFNFIQNKAYSNVLDEENNKSISSVSALDYYIPTDRQLKFNISSQFLVQYPTFYMEYKNDIKIKEKLYEIVAGILPSNLKPGHFDPNNDILVSDLTPNNTTGILEVSFQAKNIILNGTLKPNFDTTFNGIINNLKTIDAPTTLNAFDSIKSTKKLNDGSSYIMSLITENDKFKRNIGSIIGQTLFLHSLDNADFLAYVDDHNAQYIVDGYKNIYNSKLFSNMPINQEFANTLESSRFNLSFNGEGPVNPKFKDIINYKYTGTLEQRKEGIFEAEIFLGMYYEKDASSGQLVLKRTPKSFGKILITGFQKFGVPTELIKTKLDFSELTGVADRIHKQVDSNYLLYPSELSQFIDKTGFQEGVSIIPNEAIFNHDLIESGILSGLPSFVFESDSPTSKFLSFPKDKRIINDRLGYIDIGFKLEVPYYDSNGQIVNPKDKPFISSFRIDGLAKSSPTLLNFESYDLIENIISGEDFANDSRIKTAILRFLNTENNILLPSKFNFISNYPFYLWKAANEKYQMDRLRENIDIRITNKNYSENFVEFEVILKKNYFADDFKYINEIPKSKSIGEFRLNNVILDKSNQNTTLISSNAVLNMDYQGSDFLIPSLDETAVVGSTILNNSKINISIFNTIRSNLLYPPKSSNYGDFATNIYGTGKIIGRNFVKGELKIEFTLKQFYENGILVNNKIKHFEMTITGYLPTPSTKLILKEFWIPNISDKVIENINENELKNLILINKKDIITGLNKYFNNSINPIDVKNMQVITQDGKKLLRAEIFILDGYVNKDGAISNDDLDAGTLKPKPINISLGYINFSGFSQGGSILKSTDVIKNFVVQDSTIFPHEESNSQLENIIYQNDLIINKPENFTRNDFYVSEFTPDNKNGRLTVRLVITKYINNNGLVVAGKLNKNILITGYKKINGATTVKRDFINIDGYSNILVDSISDKELSENIFFNNINSLFTNVPKLLFDDFKLSNILKDSQTGIISFNVSLFKWYDEKCNYKLTEKAYGKISISGFNKTTETLETVVITHPTLNLSSNPQLILPSKINSSNIVEYLNLPKLEPLPGGSKIIYKITSINDNLGLVNFKIGATEVYINGVVQNNYIFEEYEYNFLGFKINKNTELFSNPTLNSNANISSIYVDEINDSNVFSYIFSPTFSYLPNGNDTLVSLKVVQGSQNFELGSLRIKAIISAAYLENKIVNDYEWPQDFLIEGFKKGHSEMNTIVLENPTINKLGTETKVSLVNAENFINYINLPILFNEVAEATIYYENFAKDESKNSISFDILVTEAYVKDEIKDNYKLGNYIVTGFFEEAPSVDTEVTHYSILKNGLNYNDELSNMYASDITIDNFDQYFTRPEVKNAPNGFEIILEYDDYIGFLYIKLRFKTAVLGGEMYENFDWPYFSMFNFFKTK